MNDRLFQRVIETIARFDTVDLLTAVAALQVMPVNISRTVRLEVLAHAIATQAADTKGATPSLDDLRRLCNNKPLASFEITRSEDPPEWHFVEPMPWRGSSFLVFPGIADDSAFSFRHLAQALNVPPEFDPHPALISDANRLIGSVLRLSPEVARRGSEILSHFMQQGLRAAVVGLILGLVVVNYAQRWFAGMLYKVGAFDPATLGSAMVGVLTLLVIAVWWPARRAATIDPQGALPHE